MYRKDNERICSNRETSERLRRRKRGGWGNECRRRIEVRIGRGRRLCPCDGLYRRRLRLRGRWRWRGETVWRILNRQERIVFQKYGFHGGNHNHSEGFRGLLTCKRLWRYLTGCLQRLRRACVERERRAGGAGGGW